MMNWPCQLVACAITLVIIGPVLIIVGLVMLTAENNREEQVNKYNTAVKDFNVYKSVISAWGGVTADPGASVSILGSGNAVSLPATTEAVAFASGSNDEGVDSATSTLRRGTLTAYATNSLTFRVVTPGFTTSAAFPNTKTDSRDIQCQQDTCDDYCGSRYSDSDRECNSDSKFTAACRVRYNAAATFIRTESFCSHDEVCGRCQYPAYASKLCAVVEVGVEGELSQSSDKVSCKYPFTASDGEYTATSGRNVVVEMRSSKDPYVVLQVLTKGAIDFGITEGEQRSYGMTCLVIGIIITCLLCGLLCYACNRNNNQQQQQQQQGQIVMVQQQEMQQQQQPYAGVVVAHNNEQNTDPYYHGQQQQQQQYPGYPQEQQQQQQYPGYPQQQQPAYQNTAGQPVDNRGKAL